MTITIMMKGVHESLR